MAPQFALFLSPEGIALAHRQTAGHWAVLGDTPIDVPDLGAALVVLRKLAEARVGKGFETLIILPDDQVLYTSLTAPGPDEDTRLEQIRNGLEGLTPYGVDELVFDWADIDDGRVKLAVVAKETLDEAREFAEQHGFPPAGFGARPLDNRFPGIAHFDRTPDWIAETPDIEFGRDTWQTEQATAQSTQHANEAPEPEDTAPAPDGTLDADGRNAPGDAPPTETAASGAPPAPGTGDAAAATKTEPQAPPTDQSAPQDTSSQDAEPQGAAPPAESADSAPGNADAKPEAEAETPAARRRLTLTAEDSAPPSEGADAAAQAPADTPDPSHDPERPDPEDDSPAEAPLKLPVGFGAHRRRIAPEAAGTLLRNRKTRFGPATSEEPKPGTPDLPRKKARGAPDRAEPVLGRATGDADAKQDPPVSPQTPEKPAKKGKAAGRGKPAKAKPAAPADTKADAPADTPERPPGAGPQPELPPLARVKSKIEAQKATGAPRPNPFDGPPDAAKPSLRDRVAGIGRKMSGGESGLSRRGSGLGEKLRSLPRKTDEAPKREADQSPDAEPVGPEDAATPARKRGKAAGASAAQGAAAIAPPPAETARKPFAPPQRTGQGPAIDDADAPIMGGLLARGSIASQRGPSLRGGLILTLVLLAVLALLGLWAAVYLPETALGRWMGLGDEDEAVIIVETDPAELDQPSLDGDTPAIEDAPPPLAALPPDDATPEAATTPPQAPELLPDIDAEDLDLGPAPVDSPVIDPETVLPSEEENANFYARTGIWQRPPVITQPDPDTRLEEVIFVGLDPVIISFDAYALPEPDFTPAADLPRRQSNPLSPETELALGEDGLVEPSEEGTLNPDGILVYAGSPSVLPQLRPEDAPAVLAAAEAEAEAEATANETGGVPPGAVDTALLRAVRPETRPEDLQEQRERAVLGGITYDELAAIRPEERPQSLQEAAAAVAEANAQAGDIVDASELAVAVSYVPPPRPGNIDDLVEEARAAGNTANDPPAAPNRSDTVEPEIPSSASVTRAATEENAINLRNVNLIGVSGTSSQRRALVRLPSGRFVTVEVGDRLDGGQVAAIGESSLQYVKRGRTITLDVPTG